MSSMRFTTCEDLLSSNSTDVEKLAILSGQYRELLKEQSILLESARILGDNSISVFDAIKMVIQAIPNAFQYPEICQARYRFKSFTRQTEGFIETPWMLRIEGAASDGDIITLEIVYLEQRPTFEEGPFMKGEYALAQALHNLILIAVNRQIIMDNLKRQVKKSEIEQKKAEFIIHNAPIPIFEINPELQLKKTNPIFPHLTGYTPDELLTMKLTDFDVVSRDGKTVKEAIENHEVVSGEVAVSTPAGVKNFEYRYLPIFGSKGQLFSIVNFYIDKTAEKQAAKEIIKITKEAKSGNLDIRVDGSPYSGEIRQMIIGINETLDAVTGPVKAAMRIADQYAHANFSARMDETLQVTGSFARLKESLDNIGTQVEFAVHEIQRIAGRFAQGDFTAEFDKNHAIEGDLADVKVALDGISTNISAVLKVISERMAHLSSHAETAGSGIRDISQGAELIANEAERARQNAEKSGESIEQVLNTMETLTGKITEVSTRAGQVAQLSIKANDLSRQGIFAAQKAEHGMQEITRKSEQVDAIFSEIRIHMQEIGKIVQFITDIANQTNLLALNAAIEAARAGDAGKGFAVVASEVKSLALRSRESADQIADMITELQRKSEAASTALGESGVAVTEGSGALGDTLGIFNSLSASVDEISTNMEQMERATEEQTASFEEISASVHEMSARVKETAKDALNSSATSEEALAVVSQITKVIAEINDAVSVIGTEMERFSYK